MISEHSQNVARRAKAIYAEKLQTQLESEHPNKFVAIEPESEEYFIAESFSKAVAAARQAHPDRISFVIRIGHEAALHIGVLNKPSAEQAHQTAMQADTTGDDVASIQRGIEQMEAGLGRPIAEADRDLRQKLGFPPRA